MGAGVESPQGAGTPGVAEEPQGDETPSLPTVSEGGLRKDGQGQGGRDKNSPTAQATRMKGADGI